MDSKQRQLIAIYNLKLARKQLVLLGFTVKKNIFRVVYETRHYVMCLGTLVPPPHTHISFLPHTSCKQALGLVSLMLSSDLAADQMSSRQSSLSNPAPGLCCSGEITQREAIILKWIRHGS